VLSAAVDAGCDPIIHVSSVAVFALTGEPITLDTPPALSDGAYARSKSESEWFARGLQRAGAPVTITYPGGVLGPYTIDLNAVHRAAQTWIAFMPLPPSGINIIDVRDLAALHVALLQTGQGPRRFLMGGRFIPWTDLIATIEDVTGRSIRRVPSPGPVMRGLGRFIDATHLPSPVDFDLTEEAMVQATEAVPIDSDATMATLGATLRPVAETMADTYRWMLERGDITEKQAGLLAPTA
jgi:dihydroflavonol-4-reductase